MKSYLKCFFSIWLHKWYVFQACLKVGGVPWYRILFHDWVKFLPVEFFGYADRFFGGNKNPQLFQRAWLHHQNSMDHHPEYWISVGGHKMLNGFETYTTTLVEMPKVCVREMVCDWMAAEKTYQGKWDMTDWLRENLDKKLGQMHNDSGAYLVSVLLELGYRVEKL